MKRMRLDVWPSGLHWVNTDDPPQPQALRGRLLLLWFWSYDSVNCQNLVADLQRIERASHDGVVVVGVHCPKYPQQAQPARVLQAANRLGLRHAVASDADFALWRACGIVAWPSIALVDTDGRLDSVHAGEGRAAEVEARIAALLDDALARDARVYESASEVVRAEPRGALSFPGRVLVDEAKLYVSDSGNRRVLECLHDGRIQRVFGSGNRGHADGSSSHACFDEPQGLARVGTALYVADTGNHCVRRIDLVSGEVDTVLGGGRAGRSRPAAAPARSVSPNRPLDLAVAGEELVVAVAGQHQLWRFDPWRGTASVLAGSGNLGLADGMPDEAAFAQPSGLAVLGAELVVADAATSAVRTVAIATGRVATVVGQGLYESGDSTGPREATRLCNPLAIAADPRGLVYVADTFNDAIRLVSRRSGESRPLRLTHVLREPGGLALARDALWIANTGRHEIVRLDLASGVLRRVPVGEG